MTEKFGFEIIGSRVKGVPSLKFKTILEAEKIRKRVGGRVVKTPFKNLKGRKLYFRRKDGTYGYL